LPYVRNRYFVMVDQFEKFL